MNASRQEDGETVSNRQVGYGLVFGVPKSLSIYLAITADRVVENIARSAVDETMRAMEAETGCAIHTGTSTVSFTEQCDTYSCARGRLRRPGFGSGPLSPMPDRMTGLLSGNSATRESLPPMAST
jgi:TrwC relaxase